MLKNLKSIGTYTTLATSAGVGLGYLLSSYSAQICTDLMNNCNSAFDQGHILDPNSCPYPNVEACKQAHYDELPTGSFEAMFGLTLGVIGFTSAVIANIGNRILQNSKT